MGMRQGNSGRSACAVTSAALCCSYLYQYAYTLYQYAYTLYTRTQGVELNGHCAAQPCIYLEGVFPYTCSACSVGPDTLYSTCIPYVSHTCIEMQDAKCRGGGVPMQRLQCSA